jgi:hypothetical protein
VLSSNSSSLDECSVVFWRLLFVDVVEGALFFLFFAAVGFEDPSSFLAFFEGSVVVIFFSVY